METKALFRNDPPVMVEPPTPYSQRDKSQASVC